MAADVPTACEHCGASFVVPPSLVGGVTNCESCGKATQVAGLNDPVWRALQFAAVVLVVAAGVFVAVRWGLLAGLVAGLVLAALGWLISRAL